MYDSQTYEKALDQFFELLGSEHPKYNMVLTLQARLLENLNQFWEYGNDQNLNAERARIIGALNKLAIETLGKSFNDLIKAIVTGKQAEGSQSSQQEIIPDKLRDTDATNGLFTTLPYMDYDNRDVFIYEATRYLMKDEKMKEIQEQLSYARVWFRSRREQMEGYEVTVLKLLDFLEMGLFEDLGTILYVPQVFVHLSSEINKLLQLVKAVDTKSPSSQLRYLSNDLRRVSDLSSEAVVYFNTLIDKLCDNKMNGTTEIKQILLLMKHLIYNINQWLTWMVNWFDSLGRS